MRHPILFVAIVIGLFHLIRYLMHVMGVFLVIAMIVGFWIWLLWEPVQ